MFKLAWANLIHERVRLAISVGGVALAILLILVLNGFFAGFQQQAVSYIRNQPAPLWLAQAGIENMHMVSSMLPPDTLKRVTQVTGVKKAVGILYATIAVQVGDALVPSYIFGIDPSDPFGGPWSLSEGSANVALNEIVIDQTLARRYNVKVGDSVSILGYNLRVKGLSRGTFGIASNMVFVNKTALASGMGVTPQTVSYIMVQPEPTANLDTLAADLRAVVPEANVMSQSFFIDREQDLTQQMSADTLRAMNTVGYLVGLLVIGLTIYTATVERAREYGILKAIGANNRRLVGIVLIQSFIAAVIGYLLGVMLSYAIVGLADRIFPDVVILIEPSSWLREIPTLVVIVTLAGLLPISRVTRADPMVVFQT
ncbi:MAG: FtsX-like permease family protein [Anaerolineae bacterium]